MRALYGVLAVAAVLAFWRLQTPTPQPLDAPTQSFSASRAFADVKAIAQHPHPVGTAEHARVEAYLVERLTAMGLAPQRQSERATNDFGHFIASAPITNITAVLKGKDSKAPAVILISHYDSVPDSPGAADDTAGVAASLEIARALKQGATLPRDVVFLFSDGEELGLIGATAFFRHNPLAKHIGAVINLEARGDAGLAAMFETGPNNSESVALWAAKVSRPDANSLARAIYKKMPNGTDFTPATAGGLPGLNFAFIGDEEAYHTALATPSHLSLGSLQHMGDAGLAAARAFGEKIPEQHADSIYSDVLGFFVIQYAFTTGWILLGLTTVLALAGMIAAQGCSLYSWRRGFVAMLCVVVLPVGVLLLAGASFGEREHFLRLAHFDYLLAGSLALALGASFLGTMVFSRQKLAAVWQWLLLLNLALAYVVEVILPEASFFIVWSLFAAALMAVIRFGIYHGREERLPNWIASVLATIITALSSCAAIGLFTAVGVDMPVIIFLPILTMLPVLLLLPGKSPPIAFSWALIGAGVLLFAYGRFAPYTEERPAPSLIRYVTDQDSGKAYRVGYLAAADRWTREALGEDAHNAPLPWYALWSTWWAPAKPVAVPKVALEFLRKGGDLEIVVKPDAEAISATLSLRASDGIAAGEIDGNKTSALKPGASEDLRYTAPGPDGFVWRMPAPKSGIVTVRLNALYPGWPKGAGPLPPLPANKMAFGNTGTTEIVMRKVWKP